MSLFGVDIKGVILGALGGQLNALTLHKVTETISTYGEPIKSETPHIGEGVRTRWRSEVLAARGWPADTVKIIVLQDGIETPTKDDAITIDGEKFRILDISRDPVNATWVIAGVRS